MSETSLYDRPDLYDLIAAPVAAMRDFYVRSAGGAGRTVLDLACGTGRITLPLAASGAEATGGDLSEKMLELARKTAREQGLAARFERLDMRAFDLAGQRFDRVTIVANSLLHLHSDDDFAGFFASVRRHLAPDGALSFDVFVPNLTLLSRDPETRHAVGTFEHQSLGPVTLEETIRYDPIAQVSHNDWYWSRPGAADFSHMRLELRQIFPAELPVLLARHGFRLVERFGDFDQSPLTEKSRRQVCIAEPDG